MTNEKTKQGLNKLKKGIELTIDAWKDLGLDKKSPLEFQKLNKNLKTLKQQGGK